MMVLGFNLCRIILCHIALMPYDVWLQFMEDFAVVIFTPKSTTK